MFSEKRRNQLLTLPNLLSLFRIGLIPVYLTVYHRADRGEQYLLAGTILAVSCITDMADGMIARRWNLITNVGKILDPLADKLTQLALILSLSARYAVLYPVLALFLAKEFFQCGALLFFAGRGKVLPGALVPGKLCTAVLFLSLILLVLFPDIPSEAVFFLTLTDAGFLLFSFRAYVIAYFGKGSRLTDWKKA